MNSEILKWKHATACFLFFLSTVCRAATSALPPGKLVGFSINQCNNLVCYTISGPVGFTSKLGDIFSAQHTSVTVIRKGEAGKTVFFCNEFKLEVSDEIGTCSDSITAKTTEFNFSLNKIKTFSFL